MAGEGRKGKSSSGAVRAASSLQGRFLVAKLKPDFRFHRIYEITPEWLEEHRLKALVLDVDNTLTTHNNPVPEEAVVQWLEQMRSAGIPMVILSNNHEERVRPFADRLGLPFVSDGAKPLKKGMSRCLALLADEAALRQEEAAREEIRQGVRSAASLPPALFPNQIAVVGDQLFTDILGGSRCGMTTVLVDPIEPETGCFFRIKRWLEERLLSEARA